MLTQDITYRDGAASLRGFLAYDETARDRRPGVLVVHEGLGLNDHAMERARMLAGLGYVALAADMFGDRRQAGDLDEARALIAPLRDDPPKLRARAARPSSTLARCRRSMLGRLGAIGFCFGGTVVLELARDGADLKAVVSFHGVLTTKAPAVAGKTKAAVLVCTGADDPLAPPTRSIAFEAEMRAARVRLAGNQLRRHAARLHQSGRRRLPPAERPLQRESGPPIMAADAELPCRGVRP